jgi:hypothetical protein
MGFFEPNQNNTPQKKKKKKKRRGIFFPIYTPQKLN